MYARNSFIVSVVLVYKAFYQYILHSDLAAMIQYNYNGLDKPPPSEKNVAVWDNRRDLKWHPLAYPFIQLYFNRGIFSKLNYYFFNKIRSPYLRACFCAHYHFRRLNHPHEFKEIAVNITSPYPRPGYSVHLVYCLTICPSLLEDFQ